MGTVHSSRAHASNLQVSNGSHVTFASWIDVCFIYCVGWDPRYIYRAMFSDFTPSGCQ